MPKFRKKPVVIEAWCWDGSRSLYEHLVAQGMPMGRTDSFVEGHPRHQEITSLGISTLEGTMKVNRGDWIIRGVKGEFYPCKPDIFAATYEPVDVDPPKPDGMRERCRAFITETPGASPYILEPLLRFVEAECEAERERCMALCEKVREQDRNIGEDCPSGGWGGFKLGAGACVAAIRGARP